MDQYADHHHFLVENNLLTDEMKDNIAMAGFCLVENVVDASITIDFNKHVVNYIIVIPDGLYNNLRLLERFEKGDNIGFFDSWKLRSFLKKKRETEEADQDNDILMGYKLKDIADKFVRIYLSNKWSASVEIISARESDENENFGVHNPGDKPIN